MTFMTFYTPTYKRPTFLILCRQSVQMQTCRDFQHMVIVDDCGIGVDGMFRDIRRHVDQIRGRYVFILADDDRLIDPEGLERVQQFATEHDYPPVIIVKNYKWGDVFPKLWEQEPQLGMIDTGNFIIRADVFRDNADKFGERYEGDYDFISHLWRAGYPFFWFDYIFSGMQVGGKGKTEAEIMAEQIGVIRVRAVRSFVSRNPSMHVTAGDEFDLPAGVDWLRAGLVVPVRGEPVETATVAAPEKAVKRGAKNRNSAG
jgi:glycosyltransferase involved in cell wall biosynthesis